jgi:hypothetical protein
LDFQRIFDNRQSQASRKVERWLVAAKFDDQSVTEDRLPMLRAFTSKAPPASTVCSAPRAQENIECFPQTNIHNFKGLRSQCELQQEYGKLGPFLGLRIRNKTVNN